MFKPFSFEIAPESHTNWRSPYINPLIDLLGEQDEPANAKSDAGSNKAFILLKPPTPPLIPLPAKDLFTKFMKIFIETTQAKALAEPQKYLLKARTQETY